MWSNTYAEVRQPLGTMDRVQRKPRACARVALVRENRPERARQVGVGHTSSGQLGRNKGLVTVLSVADEHYQIPRVE
jgi:hypothetical protein